ncbi:MAG: hypothetical protein K2P70_04470 [Hyphomonadaceae bacterium]|nr:hypothetical protein [Hyphomonadaceae bacterium]
MTEASRATLEELEQAKAEYARVQEAWTNDMSGNPEKYRSERMDTFKRVHALTSALKAQGDLPRTEHEELCAKLDALWPNAQSKSVVEFEGKKYRRRYMPLLTSRSGNTVYLYDEDWEPLP